MRILHGKFGGTQLHENVNPSSVVLFIMFVGVNFYSSSITNWISHDPAATHMTRLLKTCILNLHGKH